MILLATRYDAKIGEGEFASREEDERASETKKVSALLLPPYLVNGELWSSHGNGTRIRPRCTGCCITSNLYHNTSSKMWKATSSVKFKNNIKQAGNYRVQMKSLMPKHPAVRQRGGADNEAIKIGRTTAASNRQPSQKGERENGVHWNRHSVN